MVNNVQSGFWALSNGFLPEDKSKGKASKRPMKVKTLNPRVEMPYTYLIVWLVMHCPSLMTVANNCSIDKPFFVEMDEHSSLKSHYMSIIRKALQQYQNYEINRCFSDFSDGKYRSRFKDTLAGQLFHPFFRGLLVVAKHTSQSPGLHVRQYELY